MLRVLCIFYIVGYWHLMPYTTALPGYANWFTEALKYIALGTFVFCSGFLLGQQPVTLDPSGLRSFYRRRLLRIYPLYLLALILFGLAGLASLGQVIDGIFLISMFDPPAMPTLWFVTMIMAFYLLAPPLIRLADRPARMLLATALLMLALIVQHRLVQTIDLRILMYLPVFALGILYQRQAVLSDFLTDNPWPLRLLLLLMLPLSRIGNEWSVSGALTIVPLILVGATTLFVLSDRIAGWLHGPTIVFLAYTSFGLYLFHRLVFQALIGIYFPEQGWVQALYLMAVGLPAGILLAYGVQRGYDGLTGATRLR